MFRLFLRKSAKAVLPFTAPLAVPGLVYAIGDVHGRSDLLLALIDQVLQDAAEAGGRAQVVFLGDYVDRGDQVRDVIDLLIEIAGWDEIEPVFLMGNHEQMLLAFLRDPSRGERWLRFGGLQTLMSYGVQGLRDVRAPGALDRLAQGLAAAMGPHLGFVERLAPCHRAGNVLFAHAGAHPGLAPEEQDIQSLLWGSADFAKLPRQDGIWVVHGHTVVEEPTVEQGRIAIDTGAYYSGRLTAVRLRGEEMRFLSS